MQTHPTSMRGAQPTHETLTAMRAVELRPLLVFAPSSRPDDALDDEMCTDGVAGQTTVICALGFDDRTLVGAASNFGAMDESLDASGPLAKPVDDDALRGMLMFGQGVATNGTWSLRRCGRSAWA